MSMQMLTNKAAFLILHIRGEITDIKDFKSRSKFKLTEKWITGEGFEKSKENVKGWSMEKCKEQLNYMLEELELKETDLIR